MAVVVLVVVLVVCVHVVGGLLPFMCVHVGVCTDRAGASLG